MGSQYQTVKGSRMSPMTLLLLCSISLLPAVTLSKRAPPPCDSSNIWLKALCTTLDSQGCGARCSGTPARLDCSCFCLPRDGPECAKYRCDAGGWLCQKKCMLKGK